jgi:hypothetical protein
MSINWESEQSGDSLSPLYPKPVPLVGRSVCVSVGLLASLYLRIYESKEKSTWQSRISNFTILQYRISIWQSRISNFNLQYRIWQYRIYESTNLRIYEFTNLKRNLHLWKWIWLFVIRVQFVIFNIDMFIPVMSMISHWMLFNPMLYWRLYHLQVIFGDIEFSYYIEHVI